MDTLPALYHSSAVQPPSPVPGLGASLSVAEWNSVNFRASEVVSTPRAFGILRSIVLITAEVSRVFLITCLTTLKNDMVLRRKPLLPVATGAPRPQ
ncbi:hypothetical protein FRB95_014829 [Tulasnella sp. JGI-2019a]|nr:hypothetical protein FRB95_014829 [Tulasnella sp. JGI-2019a]